jgi:hypothetical protein
VLKAEEALTRRCMSRQRGRRALIFMLSVPSCKRPKGGTMLGRSVCMCGDVVCVCVCVCVCVLVCVCMRALARERGQTRPY